MTKHRRLACPIVVLTLTALAGLTACGSAGEPTIAILSPAAGSTVPVNEELSVQLSADDSDGPGIVRLELQVGDGHTEIFEAGGSQPSLTTSMMCTPSEEGPTTLTAIAYRADGTASSPATISLTVASADGAQEAASEGESTTGAEMEAPPAPSVQAQANLNTNVRAGPMPDCQIVGSVNQDQVFPVTAVTDRSVDNWYRVEAPQGWIWEGNLTLLEDGSSLPRLNVLSCEAGGAVAGAGTGTGAGTDDAGGTGGVTAACGDGMCGGGETCETCPVDCGDCDAAEDGQCGDGVCQENESADWCGDCAEEDVAACGDGTCSMEVGEDCETCEEDCGPCTVSIGDEVVVCGDGICSVEAGETCDFCPDDCNYGNPFMGCCGDGMCNAELGEDCVTCQSDCLCGPASFVYCGDGLCSIDEGEDCETCVTDCGSCDDIFHDGVCGEGEATWAWQPGTDCYEE